MAFSDGVLNDVQQIFQGEVIETSPHNIDSFDKFEDGLIIGRFAKLDSGSVDNLDGSATPFLVGVPKRKVNKAIDSGVYVGSGDLQDKNADVCNFGRITVEATSAAVPTEGAQVYTINGAANADNGRVTQDNLETDALIVPGAIFKEEKQTGIWVVTIQNYLI